MVRTNQVALLVMLLGAVTLKLSRCQLNQVLTHLLDLFIRIFLHLLRHCRVLVVVGVVEMQESGLVGLESMPTRRQPCQGQCSGPRLACESAVSASRRWNNRVSISL